MACGSCGKRRMRNYAAKRLAKTKTVTPAATPENPTPEPIKVPVVEPKIRYVRVNGRLVSEVVPEGE